MTKRKLKFISFVLSVIITVCAIPISSVGATTTETNVPIDNNTQVPIELDAAIEGKPIETITEIVSRREENVKHFRLPDGSVQAIVYANAVHRKDENGDWQDINNNLSDNNTKIANAYVTDDLRLTFAKSLAADGRIFTLNENGYSMSMELMPNDSLSTSVMALPPTVGSSTVSVTNAPDRSVVTSWSSVEEAKAINNQSSIVYTNIRANTDLEYVLVGNSIKENIIINSPTGDYTYKFRLSLGNLTATLKDDGTITLADDESGETKYHLPAPFMYDANGERSENVHYTLTESANDTYILTVIADSTWINDSDRAFPVIVDPSVDTYHLYDLYINGSAPNTNYNVAGELMVSSDKIAFFRVIMPDIPANCTIEDVWLRVPYYYDNSVTSGGAMLGAYEITQSWNHETVTWNSMAQYSNMGISTTRLSIQECFGNIGAYINTPEIAQFNVTDAFERWYNNTSQNNGIALKYEYSTPSTVSILARDAAPGAEGAYYTIIYTEPISVPSGVYKLKNVATGLYMDVTDRGTTPGTAMQLWSGTTNDGNRSQLFKIAYLTTSLYYNYYNVRSMNNCGLGLYIPSSGTVSMQNLAPNDNYGTTSWQQSISISQHNGYYVLKSGSTYDYWYLTAPTGGTNGSKLYTSDTISNNSLWILEPYNTTMDGISFTKYTTKMYSTETFDYDAVLYSSTIGHNGPVTYSVKSQNGGTTDIATINASTGVVTPNESGTIRVCAHHPNSNTYWYRTVTILNPLSGTFIKNKGTALYMQTDNNGLDFLEQRTYHGDTDQRWKFIYDQSSGYYKIQNQEENLYVTSPSNTDHNEKMLLEEYSSDIADRQLWKIIRLADNEFRLQCKAREGTSLVLAVGNEIGSPSNGTNIEQRDYTLLSNNYDIWYFEYMLPTSGFEIPYEPELWQDEVENNCNCYAYAINNQTYNNGNLWYKQQPGQYSNIHLDKSDYTSSGTLIVNAVSDDFCNYSTDNNVNVIFSSIGQYDICPDGTYKVALVIAPNYDYHWYRQDSDGMWSHKPGITAVKRTDDSGHLIFDPQTADCGIYTAFVGYFAVTPWNNYYTSSYTLSSYDVATTTYSSALIEHNKINDISIGMTYEQVSKILGQPGIDIGSGAILYRYELDNNQIVVLNFCQDINNNLVLCNIIYQ